MHVLATIANVSTPPTGQATAASAWTGIKAIRTSAMDAQVHFLLSLERN